MVETNIVELKQNSIELKKNAKGDYAWDAKIYFSDDSDAAIATIKDIDNKLRELYNN